MSDHLGSVRLVVDAQSGEVVYSLTYDAFGRVLAQRGDFELPFGFAGGLYDPATGLVRFGARDYDPRTGRWTAKDPIGFAGGDSNLYGYVLADPVNGIDPEGLEYCSPEVCIGWVCFGSQLDLETGLQYNYFSIGPSLVPVGISMNYSPDDPVAGLFVTHNNTITVVGGTMSGGLGVDGAAGAREISVGTPQIGAALQIVFPGYKAPKPSAGNIKYFHPMF